MSQCNSLIVSVVTMRCASCYYVSVLASRQVVSGNHENVILRLNITHILADLAEKYKNVSLPILRAKYILNIMNINPGNTKDGCEFVQSLTKKHILGRKQKRGEKKRFVCSAGY